MVAPRLCSSVFDIEFELGDSQNDKLLSLSPPLLLETSGMFTPHSTLTKRGFFPFNLYNDPNVYEMLIKIQSLVEQKLRLLKANVLSTKNYEGLQKAIENQLPIVRPLANKRGLISLRTNRETLPLDYQTGKLISSLENIKSGKYKFLVAIDNIFFAEDFTASLILYISSYYYESGTGLTLNRTGLLPANYLDEQFKK